MKNRRPSVEIILPSRDTWAAWQSKAQRNKYDAKHDAAQPGQLCLRRKQRKFILACIKFIAGNSRDLSATYEKSG